MYGAKKCEQKFSKNSGMSGFVSLFSELILKSFINKHIFSPLFILESSGIRYSSLENIYKRCLYITVFINTSIDNIPLIWKNQFNKSRFEFPSFDNYEVWLLSEC